MKVFFCPAVSGSRPPDRGRRANGPTGQRANRPTVPRGEGRVEIDCQGQWIVTSSAQTYCVWSIMFSIPMTLLQIRRSQFFFCYGVKVFFCPAVSGSRPPDRGRRANGPTGQRTDGPTGQRAEGKVESYWHGHWIVTFSAQTYCVWSIMLRIP